MNKLIKWIQDNFLQIVSTGVAVVMLLILLYPNNNPQKLAIVGSKAFYSFGPLSDDFSIKLRQHEGEFKSLERATILIMNRGLSAIQSPDFIQPITIEATEGKVVLVKQCVKGLTFGDGVIMYEWNVPVSIKKADEKWIIDPVLMNGGEISCVNVYHAGAHDEFMQKNRIKISARIVDFSVQEYDSVTDLPGNGSSILDLLSYAEISVKGIQVYIFIVLQSVLFFFTYIAVYKTRMLPETAFKSGFVLIPLVFLASASALSTISAINIFVVQDFEAYFININPWWVPLLTHSFLFIILIYCILRKPYKST